MTLGERVGETGKNEPEVTGMENCTFPTPSYQSRLDKKFSLLLTVDSLDTIVSRYEGTLFKVDTDRADGRKLSKADRDFMPRTRVHFRES